MNIVKAR